MRETINLTIDDFLEATSEYHQEDNIYGILKELDKRDDVIPVFRLRRQKTNKHYTTFCSPEATTEIVNNLLSINKKLKRKDKLFQYGDRYMSYKFKDLNDQLGLGRKGGRSLFRAHMLRKFHASQLYNYGVAMDIVDSLQGRGKDSTHSSYFMEEPKKLKQIYIEHMNCITINLDINHLTYTSKEYTDLQEKYQYEQKKNEFNNERLARLESLLEYAPEGLLEKIRKQ